jgi:uncharacterized protein DUF6009
MTHEAEIVWEEDISGLDYVRVYRLPTKGRRRISKWTLEGRRVGNAVLKPDAPCDRDTYACPLRGRFTRRVFYLKDHDRDRDPGGVYKTGCPVDAVDPRTVRPGVAGVQTPQVVGRV